MNRIKELRSEAGLSQSQIAEKLGVAQQSVGRWERGVDAPSVAHLRDLAIVLGTSVDYLLGNSSRRREPSHGLSYLEERDDAFWGHLALKFPWDDHSRCWPITAAARNLILDAQDEEWMAVRTLANRMLMLHLPSVEQLSLLDEGDDYPDGWKFGHIPEIGFPPDVFKALDEWAGDNLEGMSSDFEENCSSQLQNIVLNYLKEEDLEDDPEEVLKLTRETEITFRSGRSQSYYADGRDLDRIVSFAEECGSNRLDSLRSVVISHADHDPVVIYPLGQVALIDLPLIELDQSSRTKKSW